MQCDAGTPCQMRQESSLWYKRVELRGGRGTGRGNMQELQRIHQQLMVGVAQWGSLEAEVALGFPLGQPNAAWSVSMGTTYTRLWHFLDSTQITKSETR